uniref:Innexin n=1 Tax=Glossina palpalis gambiensis TaxID=67801 RepID=A0A1B0AVR2_9MUSC
MISFPKEFIKCLQAKKANIYDVIFFIHSKLTAVILWMFTLLLSAKQYFGDPIECMTDSKFKNYIHSYCWTMGTFLIPSSTDDLRNEIAVGVGPRRFDKENVNLRYYQWVVVVLLLEGLLFYMPAFLWEIWEDKRLEQLCSAVVAPLITIDEHKKHKNLIKAYLSKDNRNTHQQYAMKYFICEFLNLMISQIGNTIFLHFFLDGFWSKYMKALYTISFNNWHLWNQHSSQIFPKMAKCTFYTYGPSGSIKIHDALCMLPLNVLNEKLFAFLWIWFALMSILAAQKLIYRLALIAFPTMRVHLIRINARHMVVQDIRQILAKKCYGDWFLLYKLSRNVNPHFFQDLMSELLLKEKRDVVIEFSFN